MFFENRKSNLALLLGTMFVLVGCTRSVSNVDDKGNTVSPVFPDLSTASKKEGSYVNIDNLLKIKKGMTKNQIYELIGTPHFWEGIMRVKEWDYIFHQTMHDGSVTTCQYKVLFDSEMKAQSFYFLPDDCLTKMMELEKNEVSSSIDLNAEGFFIFDKAQLLPEGVKKSIELARNLKETGLDNKRVIITGHTDSIGSKSYNKQLSLQRAEAVKKIMVSNGIPSSIIETRGVGDDEPRVKCDRVSSNELIQCLAPNRRMSINVTK
ncbi:TPA: OmpA family protein [Enterobacter cloacae]|nr:OmpA family protein [Enterobacter cloacae]